MSRLLLVLASLCAMPVWAQVAAAPVAAPVATPEPITRQSLLNAVGAGKLNDVKAILAAHPTFISGTEYQTPLQYAASNNQLEIARFLLDKGADPNEVTANGTPFSEAIGRYGDEWKPISELMVAKGADVNAVDERTGQSLLARTLQNGNNGQSERVQWLLDKGADIYATGRDGTSALDVAIAGNSGDAWKPVVAKADPKRRGSLGRTPLFAAVRANKIDIVRDLLGRGAEINAQDVSGDTPLHVAARGPLQTTPYGGEVNGDFNPAILKALLDAGAGVNIVNASGDVPLHLALRRDITLDRTFDPSSGSYPALPDPNAAPRGLQLAPLIDKTDINLRDGGGFSPLLLSIVARDAQSRDLIRARSPKTDATTQLFDAIAGGESNKVAVLLTAKPYLTFFRLPDGETPLHIAALWGTLGAAGELVKRGADVNARDGRGQTPLQAALRNPTARFAHRARNMTAFLLAHKAAVNLATPEGDTALHFAVRAGDADLMRLLLDKGAALNVRGANGETPLLIATNKDTPIALYQTLLAKGADVNARSRSVSRYGYGGNGASALTPLFRAVLARRTDLVRALLEHGANIEARDDEGKTPLVAATQLAGYNGDGYSGSVEEIVALLLDKGANPAVRFQSGDLLSGAIDRGQIELVKTLLASKKVLLSNSRSSPLPSAVQRGNVEMVRALLDAGASPTEPDQYGQTPLQVAYNDDMKKLLNERITALAANPAPAPDAAKTPVVPAAVAKP